MNLKSLFSKKKQPVQPQTLFLLYQLYTDVNINEHVALSCFVKIYYNSITNSIVLDLNPFACQIPGILDILMKFEYFKSKLERDGKEAFIEYAQTTCLRLEKPRVELSANELSVILDTIRTRHIERQDFEYLIALKKTLNEFITNDI